MRVQGSRRLTSHVHLARVVFGGCAVGDLISRNVLRPVNGCQVQFQRETLDIMAMKNTNIIIRLTSTALPSLACGLFVSALPAQGPSGTPKSEGTIKAAVGVDAGLLRGR